MMNLCSHRKSLVDAPTLILNNIHPVRKLKIRLFSNFLTIGLNDVFWDYQDIDILILDDLKLMRDHSEEINKIRCMKICLSNKHDIKNSIYANPKRSKGVVSCDEKHIYEDDIQSTSIQIAMLLGCSPVFVANFNNISKRYSLINRKIFNNRLFSITSDSNLKHVDQFSICAKYNDKCPNKMDLMKRLV